MSMKIKKFLIIPIIFLALNIILNIIWIYFFSTKNFGACEKIFFIANFGFPNLNQAKCSFWAKEYQKTKNILTNYKINNFEKYGLLADLENEFSSQNGFDENIAKQAILDYQKSFLYKKDKIFENNYLFLLSKFEKNNASAWNNHTNNQIQNSQQIQQAQKRLETQLMENPYQEQEFVIDKDWYILLESY